MGTLPSTVPTHFFLTEGEKEEKGGRVGEGRERQREGGKEGKGELRL